LREQFASLFAANATAREQEMEDEKPNVTILSRQPLCDKIWQTPASMLSVEFGVGCDHLTGSRDEMLPG